jgi:Ser/Thr protein kinase RdoA (MazF antagonist)
MRRATKQVGVILNRFQIFGSDLLGVGGESRVYALGSEQILRIYNVNVGWDYVEQRHALYNELAKHDLPVALPELLSVNSWVGHVYTVEKRMPGQDFSKVLPSLRGEERAKALTSYLDVAAQLGTVHFPERPYGELLLSDNAVHRERWRDYLLVKMQDALVSSCADLEQDVPELDAVVAAIYARLALFDDYQGKSLVHGDYFPANVFIDASHKICGVGDFGYTTVVGDARMDLAGALIFLEVLDDYLPDDSTFMRQLLIERWGEKLLEVVEFYRLYYSIFFSGCQADDPATYAWCIGNLRAVSQGGI